MNAKPRESELDLEHRPAYRFSILAALSTRAMSGLLAERAGLTVSGWRAFSVIGAWEPISSGGVARRSSMDADKVTRAVDRLVEKGLVARKVDAADRRRVSLTLTTKGRRIYADLDHARRAIDVEFLSVLSEAERRSFFAALDKLELQARRIFSGRDAWRGLVGASKPRRQSK
jgi:DNA-binding MarR family transcriptional regulator